MRQGINIDGLLITWGDRLFYPGNRRVSANPAPKLSSVGMKQRAAALRERIAATVVRRAPQVMVKVTGGGRCMGAIAAHLRYISKNGLLEIEDDRGETLQGRHALRDLADDWRYGGRLIPEDAGEGARREALNIMLSMPRGTDPLAVLRAARAFARVELEGHKYVMVLHDHQSNPHVHLSVRAESRNGTRLNPKKADLHRWRETFAQRLREQGVEAEATRQATRGRSRTADALWHIKARNEGRLRVLRPSVKHGAGAKAMREQAIEAWQQMGRVLASSGQPSDLELAAAVARFVVEARLAGQVPVPLKQQPDVDRGLGRVPLERSQRR